MVALLPTHDFVYLEIYMKVSKKKKDQYEYKA